MINFLRLRTPNMKINIPKTLKAGAYEYAVSIRPAYDLAKGQDRCGVTSHMTQEIIIDGNMHPDQQINTFVHEMMHVACYVAGFGHEIDVNQEELVMRLTPVMHQMFRDNKIFS